MMQIKKAEKLPRNAMTLPKPGRTIAVNVHSRVTIVRLNTRRILYRGIPPDGRGSAGPFDSLDSDAAECRSSGVSVSLSRDSEGSAMGDGAATRPSSVSMVMLSYASQLVWAGRRWVRCRVRTGREHRPNLVKGMMTIIHNAIRLSTRGYPYFA
jgi:hypothetical protein